MRFSRIKWNGEEVRLLWTTVKKTPKGEETIEHRLTSKQPPAEAFEVALLDLAPLALAILELPPEYEHHFRVIGVSINTEEKDGRRGYVLTSLKSLSRTNAPAVLNTPHLREVYDSNEGGPGFADDELVAAIEGLERAATAYVNGERGTQTALPLGEPKPEPAAEQWLDSLATAEAK